MTIALALFTGSLDSMLAVRTLQKQGIEVHGLHVRTLFGCGRGDVKIAARAMGVPVAEIEVPDDYLDVFLHPRFGRGPTKSFCVDCRIYIFRMAYRLMTEIGAEFVISGEIIGQRPTSQKRKDLEVIAHHSGLSGRLLRPLSAKLLAKTEAEQSGIVDRRHLFDFHGSGRRELLELARRWQIFPIPPPSNGCTAMRGQLTSNLHDLLAHEPSARRVDFELLRIGRHFRLENRTKIILGRNEAENEQLKQIADRFEASQAAFLQPQNFSGPSALAIGANIADTLNRAAQLMCVKSHFPNIESPEILVKSGQESWKITAQIPGPASTLPGFDK